MNEMITAMATKKGAILLQYVCRFDFSPWIKSDDPSMAIETDRLKCYALRSMRCFWIAEKKAKLTCRLLVNLTFDPGLKKMIRE